MAKYGPTKFEPVSYPLTGGVDTKFHGLVLPPPKLQVCENAYVDQTGSIQRRFGRSVLTADVQGGGTVGTMAALAPYKGNLLAFSRDASTVVGKVHEYSETAAKWVAKGDVESVRVRTQNIAKSGGTSAAFGGDSATANGITVHAYEEQDISLLTSVRITVTDAAGVVLKRAYTLFTIPTGSVTLGVRCVARGNSIYVFWYDPTGTDLRVAILDATSSSTLGTMEPTPVTVTGDIDTTWPLFDVSSNSLYGIFIAWNDTTASRLSFGFVDSAGVLANTSTSAMVSDPTIGGFITCASGLGLTGMNAVVYSVGTAPNDVYALHRSWSGAAWTATATSGALDTAVGSIVSNIGCRYTSATSLRIVYTDAITGYPTVYQATFTTAAVATSRVATLRQSWLVSKPILIDANIYFWVMANTGRDALVTRVLFLMRQDGTMVAKALDVPGAILTYNSPVAIPQIEASGTSYSVTVPYHTPTVLAGEANVELALRQVTVDFVHDDSHAYVEAGESLYMAGGLLREYDGDSFVEAGFQLPFDTLNVANPTPATTAGTHLTLLAVYSYHFIWEWMDIRGQRVLGTNMGAKVCPALTGTDNKLTFVLPTLAHTDMKSPRGEVVIRAYRTIGLLPTADSEHYLVGQVTNDPTASTVTFVDTTTDAVAALSSTFYQDSGELENTAPPAGHILASGNGRVFVAGFADLPNEIQASKVRIPGRALEFSDFLPRIVVPEAGGPITAIAVMNETLLVFKETRIYRVRGEGPNNTGFGEFLTPELISADTGTAIARSVVVTPMGVMFEGVKGKMIVDQGFQVGYIGAPLEKLSAPGTCIGATLVPAMQQVRFSYSGTTHVWDYYHRQWYVFTHASEGPTCLWNDLHVALDGGVVYDNSAVFLDVVDSYTMELTLSFVTSTQTRRGDVQVRSIGLTGVSLAAHYLSVYARFDLGATIETVVETAVVGAGVLEPIWRLAHQRCSSIEITIRDAQLDVYGVDVVQATAGMKLNELAFDFGVPSENLGRDV